MACNDSRRPRVYMHPGGEFVSIGFEDTPDTLLRIGGQAGKPGAGDVERVREWVLAVQAAIDAALPGTDCTDV